MRRWLTIGIVGVWVLLLGVLARRTWRAVSPVPALPPPSGVVPGEMWMSVFEHDQKVGYTHAHLVAAAGGFDYAEESLLRLRVLDSPQTVRTRMRARTAADLSLRDITFELSSGVGQLRATGMVTPAGLRLTLQTGADGSEQVVPLVQPIYLPATLAGSLPAAQMRPGAEFDRRVFDPTTMKDDRVRLTVESWQAVPRRRDGAEAWKVREEFRGVQTTSWIDRSGAVLREEGPIGLVLVRATQDEALNQGWSGDAALDLVARTAVPVARPIGDARRRASLRLRLSGIDVERVPSGGEQSRQGADVTITRPSLEQVGSYVLPYRGTAWAAELQPTAFLQSTHPRVVAAAREALGDERDAKRAALRLNEWVYRRLRKEPTVSIPNALQVLDMGAGDCNEHAVLLAALSRAVGLPARLVAGVVYLDGAFYYHAWCEVWLDRWVSIDPTWEQFPADATHLALVRGGPEEQTALLGVVGRLGIEVLNDARAGR